MSTTTNRQVLLASRPEGTPTAANFTITDSPVPTPGENEFLVRQIYISLDPAMRGWMNEGKSYIPPVGINEVMRAGSLGVVEASNHPAFPVGSYVSGAGGVQQYAVTDGKGWFPVSKDLAPLPKYLNVLGMPGMTAYFGLLEVGRPEEGNTVVVSGAAGAVGATVGQIAKIKGCRVVGIAGGPEKCNYVVEELGFDACIDYKQGEVLKGLKENCPDGIDVYFDNVGGDILDACLARLNRGARVAVCGAISQYNQMQAIKGPKNYLSLLVNRASMQGFVVMDYAKRYMEAAMEMGGWMAAGQLKSREHIEEGIDSFPDVLLKLFSGDKRGKLILQVTEE